MPVNSRHPLYEASHHRWSMCNDLFQGQDAMIDAGTKYVPQLLGQNNEQYQYYIQRGEFFDAFFRTIQGLVDSVFRKQIAVSAPEKVNDKLSSITDSGQSFAAFCAAVVREIFKSGRCGVLIDYATEEPFVSLINTFSIINWRSTFVNGEEILSMVVLEDITQKESEKDRFIFEKVTQIRTFELIDNQCIATLYTKSEKDKDFIQQEPTVLNIHGKPIDFIPFVFLGSENNLSEPNKPPLLDLGYINIAHWRKTVDLNHGLHYTALPTPYAAGFDIRGDYTIGPVKVWVAKDPNAKAGYIEFSGEGLKTLMESIKSNESQMAVLGARLIEKTRDKVETAETSKIRQSGETSALTIMVNNISIGLTEVIKIFAKWLMIEDKDILVQLNTDFIALQISPQQITALLQSLQQGAISSDTFLYQMKIGEILPPGISVDDEKKLIESQKEEDFGYSDSDDI